MGAEVVLHHAFVAEAGRRLKVGALDAQALPGDGEGLLNVLQDARDVVNLAELLGEGLERVGQHVGIEGVGHDV